MTETEERHSACEATDEFGTRVNPPVAPSARALAFFILSRSLSQEMFVHNSGARNVIHLFVL